MVCFGSTAELPGNSDTNWVPEEQQAELLAPSAGSGSEQGQRAQAKYLAGHGHMELGRQAGCGTFFSPVDSGQLEGLLPFYHVL